MLIETNALPLSQATTV